MSRRHLRPLVVALLALGCASSRPAPAPVSTAPATPPPDAWRYTQPAALAAVPPFRAPVPVQRSLPNRLPVLLRENHAVPVVVVELAIRTGVDGDPPDKPGLADFVAGVLDEGTKSRTNQQLAEQLENLAASLSVSPGLDGIRLHLNCLSDTLQPALELLADVAMNPAFRPADVERVRGITLTGLEQRRGNPAALASDEVARLLYGPKHPWGQPAGGTVDSVKAIRRQDLVRFHDTYFRPNNALLSVSGDFEPATILSLLAERFGAWRPKVVPPSRLPPFPKDGPRTVITVDMPEGTQSQVALATRTLSATHPDALALSTANVALGGLFTSRLNQQLREVRGWTYGMFSAVGFNKRTGVFQVRGSVVASHTVDSLKDIEAVLGKYATGDITDDELSHAKEGILQSLPQALETNDAVASTFVTLSNIGRPLDWYATLPGRLGALGRDEVARVSRTYLDPGKLPVVVVGPKKNQEGLAELQLGPVVDRTAEAKGLAARPMAPSVPAAR
ncbi:MAG TPA: pitrilysin family protein [Myxococcaceae bacterium]|nr:pitrilysin family protein [Myxococcaceae bacterium]